MSLLCQVPMYDRTLVPGTDAKACWHRDRRVSTLVMTRTRAPSPQEAVAYTPPPPAPPGAPAAARRAGLARGRALPPQRGLLHARRSARRLRARAARAARPAAL